MLLLSLTAYTFNRKKQDAFLMHKFLIYFGFSKIIIGSKIMHASMLHGGGNVRVWGCFPAEVLCSFWYYESLSDQTVLGTYGIHTLGLITLYRTWNDCSLFLLLHWSVLTVCWTEHSALGVFRSARRKFMCGTKALSLSMVLCYGLFWVRWHSNMPYRLIIHAAQWFFW